MARGSPVAAEKTGVNEIQSGVDPIGGGYRCLKRSPRSRRCTDRVAIGNGAIRRPTRSEIRIGIQRRRKRYLRAAVTGKNGALVVQAGPIERRSRLGAPEFRAGLVELSLQSKELGALNACPKRLHGSKTLQSSRIV